VSFESITLSRTGDHAYQVTIWSDGVVRWDGQSGQRMGAWQATLAPDWLEALSSELPRLGASTRNKNGKSGSIVVDTSKGRSTYALARRADPAPAWRIGMLIDGICSHVLWVPLDASRACDYSPWASGRWMRFVQGSARGEALARTEGLLLLAGSTANTATAATLGHVYKSTREDLVENGGLVLVGNEFLVTRHLLFSSPSAPASVLAGSNTNGRRAWKDPGGATWAELGLG